MSHTPKYVPKHRAPGRHKATPSRRVKVLRTSVAMTSLAAVATAATVAAGVGTGSNPDSPEATLVAGAAEARVDGQAVANATRLDRTQVVSRSDRRGTTDAAKAVALSSAGGAAVTREESLDTQDPRDIARVLLGEYGFASSEFTCLDSLYESESGWRVDADNPNSSAYGIPQALTETHDMPEGYMTSAEVQIRWGLDYIQGRYGTPCSAWSFKSSHGWY